MQIVNIPLLPAARYEHAGLHVNFVLPSFLPSVKRLQEAYKGKKSTGTWVIEATEFKFEVRSDLRGHLEAAMASEATIMAVPGNMHMDARVIEVAFIKSEV